MLCFVGYGLHHRCFQIFLYVFALDIVQLEPFLPSSAFRYAVAEKKFISPAHRQILFPPKQQNELAKTYCHPGRHNRFLFHAIEDILLKR